MASQLTKAQEKTRKERKEKSFWRQLWPFLRADLKGSGKKMIWGALAGLILPIVAAYGMFATHSRLTVEIAAYSIAYLAASIALSALATDETKRNNKHVVPVLTVFAQMNTLMIGFVLLVGRLSGVNLT